MNKRTIFKVLAVILAIAIVILTIISVWQRKEIARITPVEDVEIRVSKDYEQFEEGDENIEGTENVKFSAFFLRDLDNDGYAEKIKGSCREIGMQDILYMEMIVQTDGYLKNGKIQIDGKNFYLMTALPKDNEFKGNYIGPNVRNIEFNNLYNGTQKLITGMVRSGNYSYTDKHSAIGNNINNYSRNDNKIILTGTYVAGDGTETPIRKEVDLTVDWYGSATASFNTNSTYQTYYDIYNRIDEEAETITATFSVNTVETRGDLNLSANYLAVQIPQLNGYDPISVELKSGTGETYYNEAEKVLYVTRLAEVDDEGNITSSVSRYLYNTVEVVYPLEAFTTIGREMITLKFPAETVYEGFNNTGDEFETPYVSNTAKTTIVASYMPVGSVFNITVGKYMYTPYRRYAISKAKPLRIYNGVSGEETGDIYPVSWTIRTGTPGQVITLKETKNEEEQKRDLFIKNDGTEEAMDDIAYNVGIYFSNAEAALGENGEISIIDDETNELIHTFTSQEWDEYYSSNPYMYDRPVKHIRLVTSNTVSDSYLYVYNVKEINDDALVEKYSREDFDKLQYIKSHLVAYIGDNYIGTISHQAHYEEPYSVASISLSDSAISTQVSEKGMRIYINTQASEYYNEEEWQNGEFLVKIPDEIIDFRVNSATVSSPLVTIDSYEKVINDDGKFIRIKTSNLYSASYTITINVDMTPDPRLPTLMKSVTLYASNKYCENYYYGAKDIYDVDNDGNVEENVNVRNVSLNMVSPNSLLTNQTMSEYDAKGTITISPQIADLKPIYGDEDREKQTVRIGAQITNNYASSVSEVALLGKIPFEGNTYVISGNDLGSEFSTTMKNTGITVPESLQGQVAVYYSTNPDPNRDLGDPTNGWTTYENVEDWSQIKTWLVDFQDTVLNKGISYTFYYTVELPYDFNYNKATYSHHAVFFALDTEEGKFLTQTEPTKIGIRIIDNYNIVVNKYHKNLDNLVPGATYRVSKLFDDGTIDESQTAITNENGSIEMANLYVEKVYEIKEIQAPENYVLNPDTIKIIGHVDHSGQLSVEVLEGTVKGDINVIPSNDEVVANRAIIEVEDEVKAKLRLVKYEKGTSSILGGTRYWIQGPGLPESGKYFITNSVGEISQTGLYVGETYTIQEIKAPVGYYVNEEPIEFTIVNQNGSYTADITSGKVKNVIETSEGVVPTITLEVEDEKIPRFDLSIRKIEQGTGVDGIDAVPVEGAVFRIYRDGIEEGEYITGPTGEIEISDLYVEMGRGDINCEYTLKEIYAPEGYVPSEDIKFRAYNDAIDGYRLGFECTPERDFSVGDGKVDLTIEDLPSFKLIKKDGETNELLPNVKFAIFKAENGGGPAKDSKGNIIGTKEVINGKEYYTVTTDENGQIKADLPEGIYKVVELEADIKYDISRNIKYFGIGKSREGIGQMAIEDAFTISGPSAECVEDIQGTHDGGYLVSGYSYSTSYKVGDITFEGQGSYKDGFVGKFNSDNEVVWAKNFSGPSHDSAIAVTETTNGSVIVGGEFQETMNIGGETLTAPNYSSAFITKFDADGNYQWTKQFGDGGSNGIYSLSATSDGGFIAGGVVAKSGTIDLGGYTVVNNGTSLKGVIIKYNIDGVIEWAKVYGGNSSDKITDVCETSDGNIVAIGNFGQETVNIDGEEYTTTQNDALVIKFDLEGNVLWVKPFSGEYNEQLNSVSPTKDGGVVVGGRFNSRTLEINSKVVTNSDPDGTTYDGVIAKYNKNGNVQWMKSFGGVNEEEVRSVHVAQDDGILVGARYKSSLEFEDQIFTSDSLGDGILIRYKENGQFDRANRIYGNGDESVQNIGETTEGKYLVTGQSNGSSYFYVGPYRYTQSGAEDSFVATVEYKELPTVVAEYAVGFGKDDDEKMYDVVATDDGGYIAVGYFYGSTTIDGHNLRNTSGSDGIVIKYAADNSIEWISQLEGTGSATLYSVDVAEDGGYYVGGSIYGTIRLNGERIPINGGSDGLIIKYNRLGEVEWTKSLGDSGSGTEIIYCLTSTSDGGVAVGGYFTTDSLTLGNSTIYRVGGWEGFTAKLDQYGEVEWASSFGGTGNESIHGIAETSEGDIVAVTKGLSSYYYIDDTYIEDEDPGTSTAIIIRYDSSGKLKWVKQFGGAGNDEANTICATEDGGILIGVGYTGANRTVGDITLEPHSNYNGYVAKLDRDGEVEWAKSIGGENEDTVYNVSMTPDGGFVVSGRFGRNSDGATGSTMAIGDYELETVGGRDAYVIKFDKDYNVVYATSFGGSGFEMAYSACETLDGGVVAVGEYTSDSMDIDDIHIDGNLEQSYSDADALIVKLMAQIPATEQKELQVINNRKQYRITTRINELDGVKGGTISGENQYAYEKVKYNDASVKEIVITPDPNYRIFGITVNGKEWPFIPADDGSYVMPQFENVLEDKKIEVTFGLKDNTITINKVDDTTGQGLPNATFKLDQLEERQEPNDDEIIGDLTPNGITYYNYSDSDEVTSQVLGTLTSNGTYNFVEKDGTLVPTNSKTYRTENGIATTGAGNTTANSYYPIDLTGLTGDYMVVVNARVSSQTSYDYGYATVNTSQTPPAYSTQDGRFIYRAGTYAAADYKSEALTGGNVYYLHLGYRKNLNTDTNEDQIVINSIKVYKVTGVQYNFIEQDGGYISTISDVADVSCRSYIPIDLTDYSGLYEITVNAEDKSSAYNPSYLYMSYTTDYSSGTRFMNNTYSEAVADYSIIVEGGYKYYLHFIYTTYPTSDVTQDNYLKINSIDVALSDDDFCHTEVTTNSNGQGIAQIPFGKYQVTEVTAPEGYHKLEEPVVIEFRSGDTAQHDFTIENEKMGKVIVHHRLKGTDTKLAEDDIVFGKIGEQYSTSPNLDLEDFELELDVNDEYVIPDNATGTYTRDDIEVTYYYVAKKGVVLVNHYIDGTETPVTREDNTPVETMIMTGTVGDEYTTSPVVDDLNAKYELERIPDNANGSYDKSETIVNYYYKVKSFDITTEVETYETTNILGDTETIKGGTISGEEDIVYEKVSYGEDAIKDIVVEAEDGYVIKSIKINDEPVNLGVDKAELYRLPGFTNLTNDMNVVAAFEKGTSQVTVHHYLEGTTTKVPSKNGGVVEDEIKNGAIGDPYVTKETAELADGYELVLKPTNASGNYEENPIEVIYYYKEIPSYNYTVEYYYDDVFDNTATETLSAKRGSQITSYPPKQKDGYKFKEDKGLPLTITENSANNVIKVYYEEDPTQTVEIGYTVNYYKDGVLQEGDTQSVRETTQVLHQELPLDRTLVNNTTKYDGYNLDHTVPATLPEIVNDGDVIEVYYTKKTDIEYTVNYLEKDTDRVLHEPKVVNEGVFEETITGESERIDIDGYIYESSDPVSIKINVDASKNVLNLYYSKQGDISYTVNYLEKGTENVLHTSKQGAAMFDDVIHASDEIIDIDGYTHDSNSAEQITIGTDESQNVLNIYYTKRTDLSYTVNYLENGTNNVLHDPKTVNNVPFGEVVNAEDEVIPVDGYTHNSSSPIELTVGTDASLNVINIYYSKRGDLTYTVNYLEEGTNKVIHESKVAHDAAFGNIYKATDEVITINGYLYASSNPDSITIGLDESINVLNLYYTKRGDIKYKVRYIDKDTGLDIKEQKEASASFEQIIYSVSEIIDLDKYDFVEYDKEYIEIGTNEEENVISLFYTKKESKVFVHYYKEGTTEELAPEVILTGKVDEEYHSNPAENVDENYELVEEPNNKDGYYTVEPIEVKYFYKLKDARLVIEHKEKGTDNKVSEDTVENTKRLEKFSLEDYIKDIDGYVLDREFTNEEITIDGDIVTKVIYYEPLSKVVVHYRDKDTDQDLDTAEEENIVGETVIVHPINIDGYVLVESPTEETITLTKDPIDVYYYYKKVSEGLVEKHIDEDDNSILYEEVHLGNVGDTYEILPRDFDRYELDEDNLPTNSKGTLKDELIEVIYKYKYIAKVTINYIDQNGENLTNPIIKEGYIGDSYTSEKKEFEKYSFVEVIGNPEGEMTKEDIVVTYKYEVAPNKVIENCIDVLTDEVIQTKEEPKYPGEEYKIEPIELEEYDLVVEKMPENSSGTMGDEDIVVNYYYARKAVVNVEYLDFYTGKPVTKEAKINGHVGDEYETVEEKVPGYKIVEKQYPQNTKATMTKDPITVTYFYVKEAKVTERHVYKDTVLYEETHTGFEGDEYDIKAKKFDNYIVDDNSLPKNSKGFMDEEEIVVTYRYVNKAIVIEKHIDEDSKTILAYEKHEGKVGDKYKISSRTFSGYEIEYTSTENNMGVMTKEPIEVIFWYKKAEKKTTPAQEQPKGQGNNPAPATVVIRDNGTTYVPSTNGGTTTQASSSGSSSIIKKVTTDTGSNVLPKVDPDYDVVSNVPDTDSETNRVFYMVAACFVVIGIVIIVAVVVISKKKNKKEE